MAAPAVSPHAHDHATAAVAAAAAPKLKPNEFVDLSEVVDLSQCEVLNASASTPSSNAIKKDDSDTFLISDADVDQQLLINITFREAVKLHSLVIRADKGPAGASGPKSLKLFVGKPSLSFGDASRIKATQDIVLKESELAGVPVPLKFVKFQNVHSIAVFIDKNQQDDDVTFLNRIWFTGQPLDGMNMKEFKKLHDDCC